MFEIGKAIVSRELLQEQFVCDLQACKGACCVEGEAGAPLEKEELALLDDIFADIKPYLRKEGIATIEAQGTYTVDTDGDNVTPLVEGKECAYANFDEKGIAYCAIERAHQAGATSFRKPLSCHLYPVRITRYQRYDAVNYHRWHICRPACRCGAKLRVKVYRFVKDALVRKYGREWFAELEKADSDGGKIIK